MNGLVLIYGSDTSGNKTSENYWNGFVTVGADGEQYVLASSNSYLDFFNELNPSQKLIAWNDTGSATAEAKVCDVSAGVALYRISGRVSDASELPMAGSSHVKIGDTVTVIGFDWDKLGADGRKDIAAMHSSYETKVERSVAGEKYSFFTLADPAPNANWESALVLNSEGYVVGILVTDSDLVTFFPMDAIIRELNYSGDVTEKIKQKRSGPAAPLVIFLLIAAVVAVGGFALVQARRRRGKSVAQQRRGVSRPAGQGEDSIPDASDYHPGEKLCIIGVSGYYAGQKFRINGEVTIGRSAARCNLLYPDSTRGISSIHCMIRQRGNQLEVKDLGSTYGTFCRGLQMAPNSPVLLSPGEQFSLASPLNTFEVSY